MRELVKRTSLTQTRFVLSHPYVTSEANSLGVQRILLISLGKLKNVSQLSIVADDTESSFEASSTQQSCEEFLFLDGMTRHGGLRFHSFN
jgi:hypothetical protein